MNGGYIGGDTDWIDCESALPQLVLRYVVNGGCIGGDTDWIDCETALPLLVRSQSRMLHT